jgi:hypothetical protein
MACMFPLYPHGQPVPCGSCPACLIRRTNEWTFRIGQDIKLCNNVMWIRLSYANEFLPVSQNGLPTLSKRDCQLFFKRLRQYELRDYKRNVKLRGDYPFKSVRYFLCGEYGSKNHRPHYHVVLMNVTAANVEAAWQDGFGNSLGEVWFDSRPFSDTAAGYTIGYMYKKKTKIWRKGDDRHPEFHLVSKKMGANYLTDEIVDYHRADYRRLFVTLPGGRKTSMPRYYADKIYNYTDVKEAMTVKEMQAEWLDSTVRASYRASYEEFCRLHGEHSREEYVKKIWYLRKEAVRLFHHANERRDN